MLLFSSYFMAIDSGSISWDFLQKKVDLLFKGEFSSFSNLKIENTTIEDMVQRGWYIDLEESTPFLGEIRSGRRILLRDDLKGYDRISLLAFPELCSTPNEQVLFPFCSPLWKRGILMRDS